jgi:hypothetical protein
MILAITIWSPGEVVLFLGILAGVAHYLAKKYLDANPSVKDAAKEAAAKKAIGLIAKLFGK